MKWHFCFSLHAKRTSTVPISFKSKGLGVGVGVGINVMSARLWKDNSLLERSGRAELGFRSLFEASAFKFPSTLPGQDLTPAPFVNGSRYQHSVCTVLDREKYSTLHTCGTKILPCEEDGMVVVLSVLGVAALLRVGPSAHLLQAARWVTTLDQADGLEKNRPGRKRWSF